MRTILTVAAVAVWAACSAGDDKKDEKHTHLGPHKGAVAEWGEEEYHLEVVPDAKAGTVTVYVYGDHDELHKGVPRAINADGLVMTVKADKAVTIKLEPARQKLDPEGKASVFTAKHAVFSSGAKLSGTISGQVGTKPYSGDVKQK